MRSFRWISRWLLSLLLAAVSVQAHAVPVTDDRGVTVDLPRPPQRIVTLLPSLTESVCELGGCERLVGVDSFSNWPQSVQRLPHVGGLDDANVETIVSLRPDLVLLTRSSRALARLQGLGIPVFALEPKNLKDVRRALDRIAVLIGAPDRAARVWARVEDGLARAAQRVPSSQRGMSVYFEVGAGPFGASEASHIGELLTRLDARNIVPASLGSVPKLNPEFVVRADPQVIIVSARDAAELPQRPGWSRIRAVRDHRVCSLDAAQADVVMRPGPRLPEAADVLADCLTAAGGAR